MRIRSTLGAVSLASCLAAGCRKPAPPPEPAAETAETTTVTEQNDNGTVSWDVEPDGQVRASVKATDGRAIVKDLSGTVTWPGELADQQRALTLDDKGTLVATGPALEQDLTEIDYSLMVEGKPWTGVLHVPRGGTQAIQEDARADAAVVVPPNQLGPHGGTVQVIGGQRVEMVADRDTQEVRVYTLGPDYRVIDPGDRTFEMGYEAQYPGMQVLVREPGADYYVGAWAVGFDPFRVTLGWSLGGVSHFGIIGWHYGETLRFGVGAPRFAFAVASRGWAPSVGFHAGVGMYAHASFGVSVGVGIGGSVAARGGVGVRGGGEGHVAAEGHGEVHGGEGHGHGEAHGAEGHGEAHGGEGHGHGEAHGGEGHAGEGHAEPHKAAEHEAHPGAEHGVAHDRGHAPAVTHAAPSRSGGHAGKKH
jgi:hypothetical protein